MAPFSSPPQALLATLLTTPDCSVDSGSLQCRLLNLLHILHILGAILAAALLVVLVIAIRAWRAGRNTDEIPTPHPGNRKPPQA